MQLTEKTTTNNCVINEYCINIFVKLFVWLPYMFEVDTRVTLNIKLAMRGNNYTSTQYNVIFLNWTWHFINILACHDVYAVI